MSTLSSRAWRCALLPRPAASSRRRLLLPWAAAAQIAAANHQKMCCAPQPSTARARQVLPSVATVTLMTVLLALLTLQLARRAVGMHAAETRALRARAAGGGCALAEPLLLPPTPEGGEGADVDSVDDAPSRGAPHIPRSSSLLPPAGGRRAGGAAAVAAAVAAAIAAAAPRGGRDQQGGAAAAAGAPAPMAGDSPASNGLFVSALAPPLDAAGRDDAGGAREAAPLRRDADSGRSADIDISITAASDDGVDGSDVVIDAGGGGGGDVGGRAERAGSALAASLAAIKKGAGLAAGRPADGARAGGGLVTRAARDDPDLRLSSRPPAAGARAPRRPLLPLVPVLVLVVLSALVAASDELKAAVECGTW